MSSAMVEGKDVSQRIDAVRNRKALVAAAEQVFSEMGPDAPLELVARRAHVGRGTLYRHFRDRIDLAAAVYETHLTELEEYVAERADHPEIALELLTRIAQRLGEAHGIQPLLLRAEGGRERLDQLDERTRQLLAGPLRTSQEAGSLSPELTIDDLLILIDMIEGALTSLAPDQAQTVAQRAFELLLPGITEGPGDPLPGFWDTADDGSGHAPSGTASTPR